MKLVLGFELSSEKVDIDYRSSILSFIKHLLSTKYEDDYNSLFSNPTMKSYTFSVYFPNITMEEGSVRAGEKQMSVTISGYDHALIAKLYNASLHEKHKGYPMKNNTMVLQRVRLDNAKKRLKERSVIKFLCPLIVRKRIGNKDTYLTYKDEDFNKYVNITISNLFKQLEISKDNINIDLKPFNARTTVIKHGQLMYQANIGTFILEGDTGILEVLYQTGIGSRRGQGFGMFEIIGG